MAAKGKREAGNEAPTGSELGFAAFLDLRDSTYFWNQNPDLAEEALSALARTVEAAAMAWQGRIGNFTGDGFLVLFPNAEYAIRGLARVIEEWEPQRLAFSKDLALRGAPTPDECSLMVRTGVAHGHYRFLQLFSGSDVSGEAVNRASRCEGASKTYFVTAPVADALAQQQRIFITQDVFSLIGRQGDYWRSERLPVEFKGYERPAMGGLVTTPDHIIAVWPRFATSIDQVSSEPGRNLEKAAVAASKVDVADRLVAAASTSSPHAVRRPGRDVLANAIAAYREALANLPETELNAQRAEVHGRLGLANTALADAVAQSDRRACLDEALQEFKSALGHIDSDDDPEQFGAISSNVAAIRRRQAELVPPAERAYYLTEAVRGLRNVLQTPSYIADANRHSMALGSLAQVLGNQAEFLAEDVGEEKWREVGDVLRRAIAVTTPAANPHHYASLQSDLSNAVRMEARYIDSKPSRESLLADGESIAREAAKALDASAAPSRYANAQVNLGLVLLDRSQLASRTEAMLMVAEAADAFKEALKVNDAKEYWHKRATILENLALALKLQASLLGGSDRSRHLSEARRVTEQALRIYQDIGYTESADRLARAIEGMAEVPM
jgi:class 3 adenylate cyclase